MQRFRSGKPPYRAQFTTRRKERGLRVTLHPENSFVKLFRAPFRAPVVDSAKPNLESLIPNPQSPIPDPQSPIPDPY